MAFRIFIIAVLVLTGYFAFETVRLKLLQRSLFNETPEYVFGNPDGDLSFAMFFDYSCDACRRGFSQIKPALARDGNVRFILRPLSKADNDATHLVYAAGKQGKFAQAHAIMLENYRVVDAQVIEALAMRLEIDLDQLKNDMDSEAVREKVVKNMKLFQRYRMGATPVYAIGKTIMFTPTRDITSDDFISLFAEARNEQ